MNQVAHVSLSELHWAPRFFPQVHECITQVGIPLEVVWQVNEVITWAMANDALECFRLMLCLGEHFHIFYIPLQISPGGLAPWFSSKEVYFWKLPTLEKQDPVTKQKNKIRKNQGLTNQLFFTTLTTNLVEKWILMIFSCFNMRKMRIPFPFLSGNFRFLKGFDVLQIPGVWSSFERFENFENFDSNTLIFASQDVASILAQRNWPSHAIPSY